MYFNPYPNQVPYPVRNTQPPMPTSLVGRLVTNIEEAKAIPLEFFDGTGMYMPSPSEGKIFVKYINSMGLPVFETYVKQVDTTPTLETRIQRLENILKELGYDDKPANANSVNEKQ